MISGVVTYQVLNSRKVCSSFTSTGSLTNAYRLFAQAALEVKDPDRYIRTQGLTVMKKIASMYPYESRDAKVPRFVEFVDSGLTPADLPVLPQPQERS
jgi:hypothetical protein